MQLQGTFAVTATSGSVSASIDLTVNIPQATGTLILYDGPH
jgi:hypothetical protein